VTPQRGVPTNRKLSITGLRNDDVGDINLAMFADLLK